MGSTKKKTSKIQLNKINRGKRLFFHNSRVELDPAGLYGGDPDYEDWANSPAGLRKLNVGFVYEKLSFFRI